MKRILFILGAAVLLSACQPAKVSSSGDSSQKLMAVTANDPEDTSGSVTQTADPEGIPPVVEGTPPPPAGTPPPPPEGNPPPPPPHGNKPPQSNKPPKGDGSGQYVCILEGPGKSVKLGQNAAGDPGGQHKIPQVLCMSQKACLEIASQAFGVKGPEFRGYCKLPHGNPHVHHVTDAQLQTKVDEYLKN